MADDGSKSDVSNTGELRPVGFFVTMKYRCPNCQQSYFRTVEETRRPIRCECGAELRHQPIASVDVKVTFQSPARAESQP